MRDIQLLVLRIERGACPLARNELPEVGAIEVLSEGEGGNRRGRVKTKPLAHLGDPNTVDLLTKAELDVGNGLLVVLELQRGEELKGETRVSSLGDVPEGSAYPNPTRETEELLLESQSLESSEIDNPGVAKLPLAQSGVVLRGALSGVRDSLISPVGVGSVSTGGCARGLVV
jgi:hypothetical protein